MMVLVELIGINKGRHVTLKYFNILIKIDKEHRNFFGSWTKHKFDLSCCEIRKAK